MEREEYKYLLFNSKRLPFYRDDNGFVLLGDGDYKKPNGQPASLEFSPSGWLETLVRFYRNETFLGVWRDMTVPMKFVRDGALILQNQFWKTRGVEAAVFLAIEKLDRFNLPYEYLPWYLADIDFSKYEESQTGVTVNAIEGGPSKYLMSNRDKVYEIPIDENPEHKTVLMDGREFDYSRTFGVVEDQEIRGTANFYLGTIETDHEGFSPQVLFFDVIGMQSSIYPNDDYFLLTKKVQDVTIEGEIEIYFNKEVAFELRIETNDGVSGSGFPQYPLVNIAGNPRPAGTTEKFLFSESFTLPADTRCHAKIYGGTPTDATTQFTVKSGTLRVKYVYRHKESYVNGLYWYTLGQALVDKMTEGNYTLKSDWLAARKDIIITCADSLRGIKAIPDPLTAGPVIKISFNNYIKSLRFSAVGVEGDKIVIEKKDYFFRSDVISNIGKVSEATLKVADKMIPNSIKAGYPKSDYEDVNGRSEVNQGQEWSAPITSIIETLDLISSIRSDSLGIEILRINFEGKKTTDSSSDSDNFMLNVETVENVDPDGVKYYKLYRPAFSSIEGIPHPASAFNVLLNPKQAILDEGSYISSVLDLQETELITFLSADKNKDLVYTLGGVTLRQSENIQVGSLAPKLFAPYFFNFTTKGDIKLIEIMKANPYGLIQFEWNNKQWFGYIWDSGVNTATRESQKWLLLAKPGQQFFKFNTY